MPATCGTAAHIGEILRATRGWSPHPRTLQCHFKAQGLIRAVLTGKNVALGRFEATCPTELRIGDALHIPVVSGCNTILFCFLDDQSRLVTGQRFSYQEDTPSAQSAPWRGIPPMTNEESAFANDPLQRIREAARGLPRALNNFARQPLVAAYANRAAIVDEKSARQIVAEFEVD